MLPLKYFEISPNNYKIFVDEVIGAVCIKWNGHITSSMYKESMWTLLDEVTRHQHSLILFDNSSISFLSHENYQWLNKEWMPMLQNLLQNRGKLAHILSKKDYTREAVQIINDLIDTGRFPQQQYFNNLVEARAWLFEASSKALSA